MKELERIEIARLQKLMESSDNGNEISYGSASAAASEALTGRANSTSMKETKEDAMAGLARPTRAHFGMRRSGSHRLFSFWVWHSR